MIIHKEDVEKIKSAVIDEERLITPFRIANDRGDNRTIYTDHNAMLIEVDWYTAGTSNKEESKVMTTRSYKKFAERIKQERISEIWDVNKEFREKYDFQERYDIWSKKIMEIKKDCEMKQRKRNCIKEVREMIKLKRKVKREQIKEENPEVKKILARRMKLLNEYIVEEEKQQYAKRIIATVENLRKTGGGIKETTFWEFKKKLHRKQEEPITAMKNKDGVLLEDKREILKIYEEFYTELFTKKKATDEEEQRIEKNVKMEMNKIMEKAKEQENIKVTEEDVEKAIRKLKTKKAGDKGRVEK